MISGEFRHLGTMTQQVEVKDNSKMKSRHLSGHLAIISRYISQDSYCVKHLNSQMLGSFYLGFLFLEVLMV
jgi:hypothetical protein